MSSNPNESTREDWGNQVIAICLKSVEEGNPTDRQALLTDSGENLDLLLGATKYNPILGTQLC
jgi:hypothetical protein